MPLEFLAVTLLGLTRVCAPKESGLYRKNTNNRRKLPTN